MRSYRYRQASAGPRTTSSPSITTTAPRPWRATTTTCFRASTSTSDVLDNLKSRASWGKTIGRPGWGDIQGGQVLDQLVRINGGTGSQGNPALKPLESTNIDLSLEWYYAEGATRRSATSTRTSTTTSASPRSPSSLSKPAYADQGALFNEAVGGVRGDLTCIRN